MSSWLISLSFLEKRLANILSRGPNKISINKTINVRKTLL